MSTELKDRTYQFARNCIALIRSIDSKDRLFWHIERQLLRCSTSVAANYRAANLAQSKPAFVPKLSIVVEESDEYIFWLQLLVDEGIVNPDKAKAVIQESKELTAIFVAARKTAANRALNQ
jgi:four helix bundle protein